MEPVGSEDRYHQARFVTSLHWGVIIAAPVLLMLSGRATGPAVWIILSLFALFTAVLQGLVSLRPPGVPWSAVGYAVMISDLLLVTTVVWARGGLDTDAYHFYYLVIVGSALLFGSRQSFFYALAAGVLYGGVIYWQTGEASSLGRVAIRTVYFILTGVLAGHLSAQERRSRLAKAEAQRLLTELQEAHTQLKVHAREMSQRAITDGLTGLFNHTYFHQRLDEELSRSERYRRPLSLLMLDLDGFKAYNDAYGHPKGDLILAQVAGLVTASIRRVDIACRYGGEEFAVILPETGGQAAVVAGERIRQAIEGALLSAPHGEGDHPARGDGFWGGSAREGDSEPKPITVSVGVASYPDNAQTRLDLVEAADQALYLSKRRGKNAVTVFQRESAPGPG